MEFPLYARALEFCAPELDSFIRVTAMNVCMNIIRLATVGSDDDEDEDDKGDDEDCSSNGSSQSDNDRSKARMALRTSTPSGRCTRHLPSCCRIASPSPDSRAIPSECARLTGQFGQVEGTVRALEELDDGPYDDGAGMAAAEKTPPGKKEGERKRLLLDDLLRVGLISLNEKAIEMMLATFVYPMLLQPLFVWGGVVSGRFPSSCVACLLLVGRAQEVS